MKVLRDARLDDMVFIDTETVRLQKELSEDTPDFEAWEYMVKRSLSPDVDIKDDYIERSALYPEFSRLAVISVGRIKDGKLFITTYKDADEKTLLERFMGDLDEVTKRKPDTKLVGHSVVGFDIPFIFKRAMANGVIPNRLIDVAGLKPWDLTAIDTKTLWKGTSNYNTSLIALCLALGIPSPKGDITGAEVGTVYYNEGEAGLKRIAEYCERDVMAVANVVLKLRFEQIFTSYEAVEPREKRELGLLERIAKTGIITTDDKAEILRRVKGASIEDKEKQIKILKATLIVTGNELEQDLELEILGA